MTRTLTLLVLLLPAAVVAEPMGLDDRISIDLRDALASQVLESFQHVAAPAVEIDPAIEGKLSIRLDNVRVRTTLQAVCESLGCEWSITGGVLKFTAGPPPPMADAEAPSWDPFDLHLAGADGEQVLRSLAALGKLDLDLDPAVSGKITVELDGVELMEAVQAVCEQLACKAGLVVTDRERSLTIVPRGD